MIIRFLQGALLLCGTLCALPSTGQRGITHASQLAFTLDEPGLHIESVAYDAVTKRFFFGTVNKRKIVQSDSLGHCSNFTRNAQDGLWAVLGIKVDTARRCLWVTSTAYPYQEKYDSTDAGKTGVFRYDLASGKLLKKYVLYKPGEQHAFGDLTIGTEGTVYITDSDSPFVYTIPAGADTLQLLCRTPLRSLQGLALDETGKYLFIADYGSGLYRLQLSDCRLKDIDPAGAPVKGIDGMYLYGNALVGIHNGSNDKKVIRFELNATQDAVESYNILDAKHPDFDEPTLGTVIGDNLYFVANSPWSYYYRFRLNEIGRKRKMKIYRVHL